MHLSWTMCGSHICAVYSASWHRAPMQTPSAHLAVQSSSRQTPFVAVTGAAYGNHSLRATRIRRIEGTDDMKGYARTTYIRARSCLVNSGLNPIAAICFGVKRECVRLQHEMVWYENECLYLPCDMLWYENVCLHVPYDMLWCARYMFTCTIQYALVCNMNVCMYHMICFGMWYEC